jgi:branched-subunit amino acid aminotransferase/4-amino-4-deoxychorismate lyase
VVEQAPLVGDMDRWEEVFITGSGRLIVPVSTIQGSTYNIAPVSFNAPGPLTNKLRHRLLYDIAKAWTPIDTLRGRQPHNPQ